MKRHLLRILAVVLAAIVFVMLPGEFVTPVEAADSFKFAKKEYTFTEGNEDTLWVTYNGKKHYQSELYDYMYWDVPLSFKSSKPEVADVDYYGRITCYKAGSCTITATYNGLKAKCTITVNKCKYKLKPSKADIYTGQTLNVKLSGQKNVQYYDYFVRSGNDNSYNVTVYNKGDGTFEITASRAGEYTVYFQVYDKDNKCQSKSMKVNVTKAGFYSDSVCVAKDCSVTLKPENAKLKSVKVIDWCNESGDEDIYYDSTNTANPYWKGSRWNYDSYWQDDMDDLEDEYYDVLRFDDFEDYYEYYYEDDYYDYYDSYDDYDEDDLNDYLARYISNWDYDLDKYSYESYEEYRKSQYSYSFWHNEFLRNNGFDIYCDYELYARNPDEFFESWEEDYAYEYRNEYYSIYYTYPWYSIDEREYDYDYYYSMQNEWSMKQAEMDYAVWYIETYEDYWIEQESGLGMYYDGYEKSEWERTKELVDYYSGLFYDSYSTQSQKLQDYQKEKDEEKQKVKQEWQSKRTEYENKVKELEKNKKSEVDVLKKSAPFEASSKGVIKGICSGYGTIEAAYKVNDGTVITVSLNVHITDPHYDTKSVTVWASDYSYYIKPQGCSGYSSMKVKSSDEAIVATAQSNSSDEYYGYYDSCYVYPKKQGKATLKVNVDGKDLKLVLNVIDPHVPKDDMILTNKKEHDRSVTNLPKGMKVTYSTSDKKIATVSKDGKVKGKKDGAARITMQVGDREFSYNVIVGFDLPAKAVAAATEVLGAKYSQDKRMSEGYYDCSSLVWRSYNKAGVSLLYSSYAPTAADLAKFMKEKGYVISYEALDASKLKTGDIIFSSTGNNGRFMNIDHVCMFYGPNVESDGSKYGGKVIQALSQGVVISNYAVSYPQSDIIVMIARVGGK